MTGMPDQHHLTQIGQAMLEAAGSEWKTITLDVTAAAAMTKTSLTIEKADGTYDQTTNISTDGAIACDELREAMYQEGKGTWYNATFVVDEGRRISADFDYENPPFGGVADDDDPDSEGDADPELLLEDHRMFPRDPDVLPEWHPARRPDHP